MKPFSKTKPLPDAVLRRARDRGLRRLASEAPDEARDAAESALELATAQRAELVANKLHAFAEANPKQRLFSGVRGRVAAAGQALNNIRGKVMGLLGIQSSPVAVKAPVITGTDPEAVEARVAGLFAFDPKVVGRTETIKRVEMIQSFVDRVQAIDPSGKVLERVSDGTPAEREESARTIAGILDNLGTVTPAVAASTKTAATTPHKPMGQSGIEASIRREIAGQTRPATPSRASVMPSKPSAVVPVKPPVADGTLISKLTGTAKAEASIRAELGQPPLAAHVHLAEKLNPETPSK